MQINNRIQYIFFILMFLVMIFLMGLLIRPYISPLIFGLILAGSFYPLMEFGIRKLKWNRALVAALTCGAIVLLVFLPSIYIAVRLTQEIIAVYAKIQKAFDGAALQETFFGDGYIAALSRRGFEFIFADKEYNVKTVQTILMSGVKSAGGYALKTLNAWLSNTFAFLFQFAVMLLIIFAIFLEGPTLKKFILDLSPLPDEDEELIMKKFNEINYVTLVTNAVGGVLQGGLAGIGFAFAGLGSPLLWTVLMTVLAFIPLLGISVVYVPASLYLAITGEFLKAGLLFSFCTFVALGAEYWFKPLFMGNRAQINSLLVFFSILGGMSAFGMAGIFYGPLIVAIFMTFVSLYQEKYARLLKARVRTRMHSGRRPRVGRRKTTFRG